jgi:hypothetical protein
MGTVFISYRRETAAGEARALFNDLVARLGKSSVFMDVDSISLGRDFRSVLQKILGSCDLMLVIIDKDWAGIKDEGGRTRLEDAGDYVRLEVEPALKRDIVVTPVLVKGAHMPAGEQLPAEIRDLVYRNGFELSHNRWESDVREMIRRLGLDLPEGGRQIERTTAPGETTGRSVPIGQVKSKQRHTWALMSALIIAALSIGLLLLYRYGSDLVVSLGRPHQPAEYTAGGTDRSTATPPPAAAGFGITDYLGGWTNADPNSRGITWISVRKDGERLVVQVWGKCHPTDCDWGTAQAAPFGRSVESSADAPIKSVSVTFSPSFAEQRLNLRLTTRDTLTSVVDTHFTDRSGRADYENTDQFVRAKTSLPIPAAPAGATPAAQANVVNLLSPEQGGQLLAAPDESWRKLTSGKEDDFVHIRSGPEAEAVYAFKDKRPATFGKFAILIKGTDAFNPKEIEILAGDDWPDGTFRTVNKCNFMNQLMLEARYQQCVFPETTARYVKIKLLSSFHFNDWANLPQIRLLGWSAQ